MDSEMNLKEEMMMKRELESKKESVVQEVKRRGRKRIKEKQTIKDQKKFFVDYSNDEKGHGLVVKHLTKANQKKYGKEVNYKDMVDYAIEKLTEKDIERIKENSLGEMDKVKLLLEKHNQKSGENLSLGEFLVKQLKIS